jgi:hypothetical protein
MIHTIPLGKELPMDTVAFLQENTKGLFPETLGIRFLEAAPEPPCTTPSRNTRAIHKRERLYSKEQRAKRPTLNS